MIRVVTFTLLVALLPFPSFGSEVSGYFYKRPTFVHLGVGQSSACAVSSDGEVWCWGSNSKFQSASKSSTFESTPFRLTGISNARQVTVGREHACALLETKRVVCWGSNEFGQLGTGFEFNGLSLSAFAEYVNGVVDVTSIFSGDDHNCAITSSKEVFCWGSNSRGQIGQLYKDESRQINGRQVIAHAERVEISGVIDLGLGSNHTCAVKDSGYVYCWGSNLYGQLGQGWSVEKSYKPLLVGALTDVKRIDSSANSICVTNLNKSLRCWGAGSSGQLGQLDTGDLAIPLSSTTSLAKYSVEEFSVGNQSTCAKLDNSVVYCWGSNQYGQVGTTNASTVSLTPFSTIQYPLTDATQIESGGDFSCVLTGNVWCWGRNNLGQLGQMTSSTFNAYAQINNPRWDLAPNSITHQVINNVIAVSWPTIGASQKYARVEDKSGKLLCQTNVALTCEYIPEKTGESIIVLLLQVLDVNGNNQSARAEYSLKVTSLVSAAEAKQTSEKEAIEKALLDKLSKEENEKKLNELNKLLSAAQVRVQTATSRLEKAEESLAEMTDSYSAAKDRSNTVMGSLSQVLNEYVQINQLITNLLKKTKKN